MTHVCDADGTFHSELPGGGVWLRVGGPNRFRFVGLDGQQVDVVFDGFEGEGTVVLHEDRRHLVTKAGDQLQLWHCERGLVASATVGRRAPSPFAMDRGRPLWDGWWFTGAHLWYAGYVEERAHLYLFDGTSLERFDVVEPTSCLGFRRPDSPQPIVSWGDFSARVAVRYPSAEPVAVFGNAGDSFAYFCCFDVRERSIRSLATTDLEQRVSESSDQVVWFVVSSPDQAAWICCDDLGFFSRLEIETEAFSKRFVRPLDPFVDGDRLQIEGFNARPVARVFEPREVVGNDRCIWVQMEVNEHAMDDDKDSVGDVPEVLFVALDDALETVAVVADPALAAGPWTLLSSGHVLVQHDERVSLYQLQA